ncbi:ricin-type beta-trefoil lectin domain protein [Williamsia sp.]|uniref:ricin-type beta-trefoil lectin domain protein n=1 Tax=Williamsia sp. TaxID=1872085 RepID=UPI002F932076
MSGFRRNSIRTRPIILATIVLTLSAVVPGFVVSSASAAAVGYVKAIGGRCLDNANASTANNNPVVLWSCNEGANQTWTQADDGTVRTQGKCLQPQSGTIASGRIATIATCTGSAAQRWTRNGLTIRVGSYCLENANNRNVDGNSIRLAFCTGSQAQQWNLVAVTSTTPPPTTTPPTTTPPPVSPSGQPVPTANLQGWRNIFWDDFTKNAAVGSWGSECEPNKIVYTGAQGQRWRAYPKCYRDTYNARPYRSDQVLSVQNGTLNFHLHNVDGVPAGANPSPVLVGDNQNQLYGRYSARMKVDNANLSQYYVAWLLWPQSEVWPRDGEFDFPEGELSGTVNGFHHYAGAAACPSCQESVTNLSARFTQWHTYTIEWSPGRIRYLLDNTVVLDSPRNVANTPMRWQLQTETKGSGAASGNLLVDWVSVWAYSP